MMINASPADDRPIRPVPRPPSDRGLYRPMRTVPESGTIEGWIISHHPVGYAMHYDRQRGKCVPCLNSVACMCAGKSMRPKWIAYLEVAIKPSLQRCVVILPQGAIDHCPETAGVNLDTLRGMKMRAYRLRPGARSPVRLEITRPESWERVPALGEPCDLEAVLEAAWTRLDVFKAYSD